MYVSIVCFLLCPSSRQVHSSRDARAVVVHMADLTCRLRERSNIPVYAKHSLALEAIQVRID